MAQKSASDRARQVLALLWRRELPARPVLRGPKQTVEVDEVIRTAVRIADRDGYGAVSIRAVATALGLGPMSLYTYVPDKQALIIAMVDWVAGEDAPIDPAAPLRERLAAVARGVRAELLAHPWLLEVPPWRLDLGPGRLRRYERQLSALEGSGFTDVEMDRTIAVLSDFATGNARTAVAARREADEMSDARWWEVYGPLLTEAMAGQSFPLAERVGTAVGEQYQAPGDPDGAFEFGLSRLLDGLAPEPV
ncbi:TetR/AcrR family transcriptional regulator [Nocardia cerradoensis]|uniref:Tetracycline repressor protein class E n=1 Tax=Nocardia cerradoensis TaxID=85688 RepID=A0A231GWL9_9NOCA|nr:TetR/AcrR family transcriptional regulator [Nocardia cerradoensis]NKY41809.1 TetR/AcrR family transcriptional regulator [Nocardia cerradoensis]OXR40978.1 Tetracycline repressor protein class E [Nocardia cerradoensis]